MKKLNLRLNQMELLVLPAGNINNIFCKTNVCVDFNITLTVSVGIGHVPKHERGGELMRQIIALTGRICALLTTRNQIVYCMKLNAICYTSTLSNILPITWIECKQSL